MESKKYVWIKDDTKVEIVDTCGGHTKRCVCDNCLGEEVKTKKCIIDLLQEGEIKEVKSMNLIEALQKYKNVTNDNGKTVYSLNKNGTIIMRTKGGGGGFQPTIELFTSTGWEEAMEPLKLPKRYSCNSYYYIDRFNDLCVTEDTSTSLDARRHSQYNYFESDILAQYISDKQLIQRIRIVLMLLNKHNSDREFLIDEYINSNYKEVIERIVEFERENLK